MQQIAGVVVFRRAQSTDAVIGQQLETFDGEFGVTAG